MFFKPESSRPSGVKETGTSRAARDPNIGTRKERWVIGSREYPMSQRELDTGLACVCVGKGARNAVSSITGRATKRPYV